MTTLIGYRWKGSNVRSRVVLIARQACAHARPLLRKGTDDDLYFFLFYDTLFNTIRAFSFIGSCSIHVNDIAAEAAIGYIPIQNLGGHGDGAHPLPFRTGKLSPSAPMVLLYQVGE